MINANKYSAHKHPGKFEGESSATEYFYEQMLNGDGETIYAGDSCAELFQISAEEADAFQLTAGKWFLLREDSQGFAIGTEHDTRAVAEQRFREWAGPHEHKFRFSHNGANFIPVWECECGEVREGSFPEGPGRYFINGEWLACREVETPR